MADNGVCGINGDRWVSIGQHEVVASLGDAERFVRIEGGRKTSRVDDKRAIVEAANAEALAMVQLPAPGKLAGVPVILMIIGFAGVAAIVNAPLMLMVS